MHDIDLTVTVDQPMPQAQDQILDRVDHRLRGVGLAMHEGVTFTFDPHGRATEVRVTGKLRDRAHTELAEALGGP